MKYLILILLFGCEPMKEKKWIPTPAQQAYLDQLSLEGRAYMDSCLCKAGDCLSMCIREYKKLGVPETKSGNGQSVLKTAAGTALGYGAAKLILGK